MSMLHRLARDEAAATAVEYGLIAGIMATAIVACFAILTGSLETAFTNISNAFTR